MPNVGAWERIDPAAATLDLGILYPGDGRFRMGQVRIVGADIGLQQNGQPVVGQAITSEDFKAWFRYVVRDNNDVVGLRKQQAEEQGEVTIDAENDTPFFDTAADDGNPAVKVAAGEALRFNEAVPQTMVNKGAKQGAIILTNAMFGIVDVDTPAAEVRIFLHMDDLATGKFMTRDYVAETTAEPAVE